MNALRHFVEDLDFLSTDGILRTKASQLRNNRIFSFSTGLLVAYALMFLLRNYTLSRLLMLNFKAPSSCCQVGISFSCK